MQIHNETLFPDRDSAPAAEVNSALGSAFSSYARFNNNNNNNWNIVASDIKVKELESDILRYLALLSIPKMPMSKDGGFQPLSFYTNLENIENLVNGTDRRESSHNPRTIGRVLTNQNVKDMNSRLNKIDEQIEFTKSIASDDKLKELEGEISRYLAKLSLYKCVMYTDSQFQPIAFYQNIITIESSVYRDDDSEDKPNLSLPTSVGKALSNSNVKELNSRLNKVDQKIGRLEYEMTKSLASDAKIRDLESELSRYLLCLSIPKINMHSDGRFQPLPFYQNLQNIENLVNYDDKDKLVTSSTSINRGALSNANVKELNSRLNNVEKKIDQTTVYNLYGQLHKMKMKEGSVHLLYF
eukprot:Awhi_evm1s14175